MLTAAGWKEPDRDVLPTGSELVAEYLRPLGELPQIAPHVRLSTRVLAVTRAGYDKMKTPGRHQAPFELRVHSVAGEERQNPARACFTESPTFAGSTVAAMLGAPLGGW